MLFAQTTGAIQGTVADAQNKPIPGAIVTIIRTFKGPKAFTAPFSQAVKTASDGTFLVQGLAAGTYSYCAQVPGDSYVNTCQWSGPPPSITVSGSQKLRVVIRMDKGSIVKIRLEDPNHLALQQSHDKKTPPIQMGIWDKRGHFAAAHLAGRDPAGFDYQVIVPLDTPLNFQMNASKLSISDGSGVTLPATALASGATQTAFQHSTGDPNPKSFQFTITGVAK